MGKRNLTTTFIKQCLADALFELMKSFPYSEINVKEICYKSGIGRTTYYRHFDNKRGKRDLLIFKVINGWEEYCKLPETKELLKIDNSLALLHYFYDMRPIFQLMEQNNVLQSSLSELFFFVFNTKNSDTLREEYGKAFLAGGFYGITYHWIKNGFPISPDELYELCNQ